MEKKIINNKGLSLLEYVVVFAIIAVVGAVMVMSLSALLNKPAQQCAAQLKSTIEKHRQVSMGKNTSDLQLYVTANGVFVKEVYDSKERVTQIGAKGVTVKYSTGTGLNTVDSTGIHIKFDRKNGSLIDTPTGSKTYISEFEISKGDMVKTVKIVPLTGKVSID